MFDSQNISPNSQDSQCFFSMNFEEFTSTEVQIISVSSPVKRKRDTELADSNLEYLRITSLSSTILNQSRCSTPPPRCSTPPPLSHHRTLSSLPRVYADVIEEITYNGSPLAITPKINFGLDGRADIAKGCHSVAYEISPGQRDVFQGIENGSLVIKVPYNVPHNRKARPVVTADSVYQYTECLRYGIPVAEILNIDSCREDGFVIQRKVKPFTEAPWSQSERLVDILENPTKKSYLDQIIELSSLCFIYMGDCGLDLKWDNLGVQLDGESEDKSTLILFDFLEDMDPFFLNYRHLSSFLSNGNNAVLKAIRSGVKSKLEMAVEENKLTYEQGVYYSEEEGKNNVVAYDETLDWTEFEDRSTTFIDAMSPSFAESS